MGEDRQRRQGIVERRTEKEIEVEAVDGGEERSFPAILVLRIVSEVWGYLGASHQILRSKFSTHIASLFTLKKSSLQPKAKPGGPGSQPYSKLVFCRENRGSMLCFILRKKEKNRLDLKSCSQTEFCLR